MFAPSLFDALEDARTAGETTLSAGVQRLARRGRMIGADVPGASWCDIDTMADLDAAETLIRAEPELVLPKPQSVLSGEGRLA